MTSPGFCAHSLNDTECGFGGPQLSRRQLGNRRSVPVARKGGEIREGNHERDARGDHHEQPRYCPSQMRQEAKQGRGRLLCGL